jgi:hypothetical protein
MRSKYETHSRHPGAGPPIHDRYDRMVPFEVSIAILNHNAGSPRGAQQLQAAAALREAGRVDRAGLEFLRGYREGRLVVVPASRSDLLSPRNVLPRT